MSKITEREVLFSILTGQNQILERIPMEKEELRRQGKVLLKKLHSVSIFAENPQQVIESFGKRKDVIINLYDTIMKLPSSDIALVLVQNQVPRYQIRVEESKKVIFMLVPQLEDLTD
ncbi:MAG: hypothetical protein ACLUD1_06670 [Clostridia bacterium]|jgi:hypothetical protein